MTAKGEGNFKCNVPAAYKRPHSHKNIIIICQHNLVVPLLKELHGRVLKSVVSLDHASFISSSGAFWPVSQSTGSF
jgi:hypothetical protein